VLFIQEACIKSRLKLFFNLSIRVGKKRFPMGVCWWWIGLGRKRSWIRFNERSEQLYIRNIPLITKKVKSRVII